MKATSATKRQKLDTVQQYATLKSVKKHSLEEIQLTGDESIRTYCNTHVVFENRIPKFREPPEAITISKGDKYRMVLRKEALNLFSLINTWKAEFDRTKRIREYGRVLWGSGGVGKSSLLFLVTQYCFVNGWVVIYLPTAPQMGLTFENDCKVMLQVLTEYYGEVKIGSQTVGQVCSNPDQLPHSHVLCDVISKLSLSCEKPVLIAFDQWNVLIRSPENSSNKIHPFVRQFSTFDDVGKGSSAVFLCAVSSQATSTLPDSAFRDATQQNCSITISPYDQEAFQSHLSLMLKLNKLQSPPTIAQINQIRDATACIARLVTWIVGTNISDFEKKAIEYYSQRVRLILKGNDDKEVAHLAASISLNKIIVGPIDRTWIDQGLLMELENNSYDAPCPSARKAIMNVMSQSKDYVNLLLNDSFRGRALELIFLQAFVDALPEKPITKTVQFSENDMLCLTVTNIVYQAAPRNRIYDIVPIKEGTLLICHSCHSVIDFVLYTLNGHLVFVQVSNTSYSQHSPKTDELNSSSTFIKVRTTEKQKEKDMTIYNFYRQCVGRTAVNPDSGLKHKDTWVLYLTPSSTATTPKGGIKIVNTQDQWASIVGASTANTIFCTH